MSSYLMEIVENPLHCNCDFPFGLSQLILLNYFDAGKTVPVLPHTDQYLLTAIPLNFSSPALEVWEFEEKKWIAVEVDETNTKQPFSELLVICGETLSKLTNDVLVGGLHRVVGPPQNPGRRFSCPYFLSASKGKILNPILCLPTISILPPTDVLALAEKKSEKTPNLEPVEVGDFLWLCTKTPNFDEFSIMERWDKWACHLPSFG
eukprot:TRINITY_DN4068_c0_g1_i10.p1 TRINITY_DN4068_c0_g1~~TRINITY_DN4068_c0_g1_i10.p1  ORF type:complete len:206 (+),score=45.27 TRINITY_DN4068_c0_g1_i10:967-1584(+)